ncbi:MAG: hydroxyisourate hydrolase [Kofleriaceae bacterium]
MITTHVLDTAYGRPASGVAVELERDDNGVWNLIGAGVTDADGRLRTLTPEGPVQAATYRIRFQTGLYFQANSVSGFFPLVEIHFTIADGTAHYHVPLLLSPYGYSTYRGS